MVVFMDREEFKRLGIEDGDLIIVFHKQLSMGRNPLRSKLRTGVYAHDTDSREEDLYFSLYSGVTAIDPLSHLMSRAEYGIRYGDVTHVEKVKSVEDLRQFFRKGLDG